MVKVVASCLTLAMVAANDVASLLQAEQKMKFHGECISGKCHPTAKIVETCDTTLPERNLIRDNVMAELKHIGYVQANPQGVVGFLSAQGDDKPSKGSQYFMNYSSDVEHGSLSYQMHSQSDAVVWIGCTPPQGAWYFGCAHYLNKFGGSSRYMPYASMGDDSNHLTMRSTKDSFWGGTMVMVTTADETASTAVIDAFRKHAPHLVPAINTKIVPSLLDSRINLRTGRRGSVFASGCRLAPGNLDDWGPPGSQVRADAKTYLDSREPLLHLDGTSRTTATKPYQMPHHRTRESGNRAEQDLESTFEAMVCQVEQRAYDMGFVQAAVSTLNTSKAVGYDGHSLDFYLNGTRCIIDNGICIQDAQDALYTSGKVPMGVNTMQVAVGVNHRLSGLATYGYVQFGTASAVHDRQSEGSASPWAPRFPDANRFFALIVRSTQEECKELQTTLQITEEEVQKWCTNHSDASEPVHYKERAYLSPVTQTGPDACELLPTKVLQFEKKSFQDTRPTCDPVRIMPADE